MVHCMDYPLCGHQACEISHLRARVTELEAKLQEKHTLEDWEWRKGHGWVRRGA